MSGVTESGANDRPSDSGAYAKLQGKRRRFVDEYLGGANSNASEAARRVGYRNPGNAGYRLMRDPAVRAAIQDRLRVLAVPSEAVVARLTEQALALQSDYFRIRNGEGSVDLEGLEAAGLKRLIKRFTRDAKGNQVVEFYDTQRALALLAKLHGLFQDRQELSGPEGGGVRIGITFEEALAELRACDEARERADGAG